ncbi:M48 family metallopeptidase [Ideonella oryzae]|uniref:M48 family metallopeptidase n=1 Tax=Ideonella oryzae TaxID=2937441 RepID=A0ABT1BLB7_9BURK|nr:M48 family metallopeptidase [Ideonella oryzae]MCO5977016.1 M48 family metallopeptidase [Ideonella oryzae]
MQDWTDPKERSLGAVALVIGMLVWLGLVLGTFGIALAVLAVGYLIYLFAQSALIAHIRGHGVALSENQMPDLWADVQACCETLRMPRCPEVYVLNGNGVLNAFTTQFLGRPFVVLFSDVVDAMKGHSDGVRFYLGHELGHLKKRHLTGHFLRWPALWLPLLGAAYSRATERTCDRHGAACCATTEGAARALVALAAGRERWAGLNLTAFAEQARRTRGFWASFHGLVAAYPWTTFRVLKVQDASARMPARNPLAYLLALCVPHAGRAGAGFGFLMLVYFLGVAAAVGLPAYKDYQARQVLNVAYAESEVARQALTAYFDAHHEVPESLEAAGAPTQTRHGAGLELDTDQMVLTVSTPEGALVFTPRLDAQRRLFWKCSAAEGTLVARVPPACR